MRNEFTAVIERDGDWFVGWTPEIPGANGQGRSVEECRASLSDAIRRYSKIGVKMACEASLQRRFRKP